MTEEVVVNLDKLTGLKSDSPIIVNIADDSYLMKPVSLRIYSAYEAHEGGEHEKKAFLLSKCLVEPEIDMETALDFPIGLANVLINDLLRASFLLPPASNN